MTAAAPLDPTERSRARTRLEAIRTDMADRNRVDSMAETMFTKDMTKTKRITNKTTTCTECDETVRYTKSEDGGDWICTECGFAIDCTECGQTMNDEHVGAHWLTENDFGNLRDLLDRLICRQEDREDRRADQLAFTYQMIKDIEAGR